MLEVLRGKYKQHLNMCSGMALENPGDTNDLMDLAGKGGVERNEEYKEEVPVKVTLWKNGFQIEEGEFRDYEEPKNKAFMEEMKSSKVPKEIMEKYKRPDGKPILIAFGLEDKRAQTFELPPPPKYTSFSGAGVSMGGGAQQ
jgi:UBX domain-containing protein 1